MSLLISLLIILVIVYILYVILGWLALPEPINRVVYIIAALIIILWLLRVLGIY